MSDKFDDNEELREAYKQGKLGLYLLKQSSKTAKRLCDERLRLGYNQAQFASRMGIHKNTQRNYENGTREPPAEYYQAAANLGVNVPYVIQGENYRNFPNKTGKIASMVFKRYNTGFNPEAMEVLFYILASSNLSNLNNEEECDEDLSSDQIDMLIKIAIEKGNEFSESFKAIIYYLLNIESSDDLDKSNAKLLTKLILETINLYDEVKDRFANVSLRDNIRLAAQQVVESYKNLDKTQE